MKKISLLIVIVFLFADFGFAQTTVTDTAIYNGNTITYKRFGMDTIYTINPATEEITTKLESHIQPGYINGQPIYSGQESSEPLGSASQIDLNSFLKSYLSEELEVVKLFYNHLELIIDKKGQLAYLNINIRKYYYSGSCSLELSDSKNLEVKNSITRKLMALKFIPAKKDGNDVPYYFSLN